MLKQQPVSLKIKKKGKLISQQNHYEKIKIIGQGTFGKVFLAKNKKDNQLYAVKQVLQDPRYKNRQLGIISRIDHENIIFMIDYYIKIINEDYYLNIVMEYMPTSLNLLIKERRKQKKAIDKDIRKLFMFQMFKGLYYMQVMLIYYCFQLNSICHRDLKPPNILINDQTHELKICDFGSAKILQKKQKNVSYICSRYYRAPQLILGSSSYNTQIDIWSAGCIVVQFLTLQPIFPGDSSIQQLIEIVKILGTPPDKLIKTYEQTTMTALPLPKIKSNSWSLILKKYNPQPELIDLISKILTFDVQARLKAQQILLHPYFHDLTSPQFQSLTVNLPNLFNFSSLNNKKNKKDIQLLDKLYNRKKQELTLKKDNSKLEMIEKQETMPSSTSPQDQGTGYNQQMNLAIQNNKIIESIKIKENKKYFNAINEQNNFKKQEYPEAKNRTLNDQKSMNNKTFQEMNDLSQDTDEIKNNYKESSGEQN